MLTEKPNKPSKEDKERIFKLWDETIEFKNYKQEDETLKWLFEKFKKNTNLDEIIVKITCLDTFYSTNLTMNAKVPDIAEKIIGLNFDERVEKGRLDLVDDLAKLTKNKTYSFASKYCAWHNCMYMGKTILSFMIVLFAKS